MGAQEAKALRGCADASGVYTSTSTVAFDAGQVLRVAKALQADPTPRWMTWDPQQKHCWHKPQARSQLGLTAHSVSKSRPFRLWKMELSGIYMRRKDQGGGAGNPGASEKNDIAAPNPFANSTPTPQQLRPIAMYPGMDRPTWQHYPERSSPPPQSQTGWFPLQETQQSSPVAASQPQSGWLQDAATSRDQRAYASSPMYASAPPHWPTEPHPQSPPTQFLPSPTYSRPLALESELYDRAQEQDHKAPAQTVLRRNKQIAIGRWNNEEHQWFLKGLEMFQGPAWGEIARLIGSRTSTQVRTHAQKFFTKLARLNQTMPHFEVQIQKERARLVTQGASVTPTAQSAPSSAISATLSPRKRLASASNSPRQSLKRFKEEVATRYPPPTSYDMKPRGYTGGYPSPPNGPVMTKEWPQSWTADDARQWPLASPTSTAASLQLTQLQMGDAGPAPAASSSDTESLPSMNKLLYRSAA
ncbi:hypothetical protein KRP22_001424 [Phytophthora ramorum]|nr:Protein REVEILLE 1 [Phytophthora ramorum]